MVSKNNLIILGMMGCGKTTIGKLLARRVGFGFMDLDQFISTKHGISPSQIFKEAGELAFRDMETSALRDLERLRSHVLALGGGTVSNHDIWPQLDSLGTTIWLDSSPEELAKRVFMRPDEIRARPLISDLVQIENKGERFEALVRRFQEILKARSPDYQKARVRVADHFATPDTCVEAICQALQGLRSEGTKTLSK